MPDFTNLSLAQAAVSDPNTSSADLQAIASSQPACWPAIVAHPNVYPALLDWLESVGGPGIADAVVKRRMSQSAPQIALPSVQVALPPQPSVTPILDDAQLPSVFREPDISKPAKVPSTLHVPDRTQVAPIERPSPSPASEPVIDKTTYATSDIDPETEVAHKQQLASRHGINQSNADQEPQQPRRSAWLKILIIVLVVVLVLGAAGVGAWALFFKDKETSATVSSFGSAAGRGVPVANIDQKPSLAWTWSVPDIDSDLKPFVKQSRVTISQGLGVVSSYFDRATWVEKTKAASDAVAGFHPMVYGLDTATGEQLWSLDPKEVFSDTFPEQAVVTVIATDDPNTVVCVGSYSIKDVPIIGFATVDARTGEILASGTGDLPPKSSSTSIRFADGHVVVSRVLAQGGVFLAAYDPNGWTRTWEKTLKGEKSATWAVSVFSEYVAVRPASEPALSVSGAVNALLTSAKTTVLRGSDGTQEFADLPAGTGLVSTPQGYLKFDLSAAVAQDKEKNPVASAQLLAVDANMVQTWDAQVAVAVLLPPNANRIDIPGDVVDGLIPVSCAYRAPINKDAPISTCTYERVDTTKGSGAWDRQVRDLGDLWSLTDTAALLPVPGSKQLVWISWKTGEETNTLAAAEGAAFSIAGRSDDYVYLSERGRDAETKEFFVNQVVAMSRSENTVAWKYDMTDTQTLTALGLSLVLIDSQDQSISGLR